MWNHEQDLKLKELVALINKESNPDRLQPLYVELDQLLNAVIGDRPQPDPQALGTVD